MLELGTVPGPYALELESERDGGKGFDSRATGEQVLHLSQWPGVTIDVSET